MIRLALLTVLMVWLGLYARKDWYRSLCGLILLMSVVEHPDMPKSLMGVQGLNPWNLLLLAICLAWMSQRRSEGLRWDMPRRLNVLLSFYAVVILVGFVRMLGDVNSLAQQAEFLGNEIPTAGDLWSEYFINCFKWVIPGLLLFDGCRSHERFVYGLFSVLGVYFLLGVQVIKWMPLETAVTGAALSERSLKILVKEIGYHRVNMSMMLAGASWAIFCVRGLGRTPGQRFAILLASGITFFAQALTGGRTGYVTWAVVGLLLCGIRWRRYLLFVPVAAVLVLWLVPSVSERLGQGFSGKDVDTNARVEAEQGGSQQVLVGSSSNVDLYTVTAGRTFAWSFVIDKISEAPFFGYGRVAMLRTGLTRKLWTQFGESFPHPHNAYLEMLLDNGLLGFSLVMPFYVSLLARSVRLFKNPGDVAAIAVGGAALALLLAFLVAAFGSQTFYPREGAVGMWCAVGLMLRVCVEKDRGADDLWSDTSEEWGRRARDRTLERGVRVGGYR